MGSEQVKPPTFDWQEHFGPVFCLSCTHFVFVCVRVCRGNLVRVDSLWLCLRLENCDQA